jgi:hypothetical protein
MLVQEEGVGGATQLLPGELLTSDDPEDAAHWVAVYSELAFMLRSLPERTTVDGTVERYERRLAFWRERLRQLSSDGAEAPVQ